MPSFAPVNSREAKLEVAIWHLPCGPHEKLLLLTFSEYGCPDDALQEFEYKCDDFEELKQLTGLREHQIFGAISGLRKKGAIFAERRGGKRSRAFDITLRLA